MKQIFQIIVIAEILILTIPSFSQSPQWIEEFPIGNTLNPTMVNSHLVPDNLGGYYFIGIKQFKMSYGSEFLGHISISRFDDNGSLLFPTIEWGGKASVQKATAWDNGNLLVTGMYYDTLILSNQDSFTVPQNHHFVSILNSLGEILYSKDFGSDWLNGSTTMENGQYALIKTDFSTFDEHILTYNSANQPIDSILLDNFGFVEDLHLDKNGNFQISGSCINANASVNGHVIPTMSGYNGFMVQLKGSDSISWFFQYVDVTCVHNNVLSGSDNLNLMCGSLYTHTLMGNDSIPGPLLPCYGGADFYLAALDSMGTINWVLDTPNDNGNGNFQVARNQAIAQYEEDFVVLGEFLGDSTIWPGGHSITDTVNFAYSEGTPALLFVSKDGQVTGSKLFKGGLGLYLHDIQTDNNGNIYISGLTNQPAQFDDLTIDADFTNQKLFVMKLAMGTTSISKAPNSQGFLIYPNPANEEVSIQLNGQLTDDLMVKIFDSSGRVVHQENISTTSEKIKLDINGIQPGIYFIKLDNNQLSNSAKLIIE
ncbi:MAG: T9SS type A sorting domain-containing protein [Bacteroidales bacterium]|nr:T9SS type A sorting domain-containing protein [Bacteroidales bacterium]MCF8455338.1 T9SS type A sorting domain-containing protein [Bacteroidales bacterium]